MTDGDGLYLLSSKEHQYSNVQNKEHITKVTFLSAIACPFIDSLTGKLWDGQLGIWVFAEQSPATCKSKNCPRGSMEWQQVSENKNKVCRLLLNKIFPTINAKRPVGWQQKAVLCQQDNLYPQLSYDNAKFLAVCQGQWLKICHVN